MIPKSFSTARLKVKPYSRNDEMRFVEMSLDAESQHLMSGGSGTIEGEQALFKKIFKLYDNIESKRIFWIWGIYSQSRLCGHLEIKETSYCNVDELELIYMVHPDSRGNGIMTELLNHIKDNQLNWGKRFIATVNPKNSISLYLLESWGIESKQMINSPDGDYWKIVLEK